MGTDSTELTFIRCPSCKSLVPAASPRCRMCGSTLEATKKNAETDDAQNKNTFQRARQNTVSVSAEDRARLGQDETEAKKEVTKPAAFKATEEQQEIEPEFDSDETDLGDPLGAFLEEVAVKEEQKFSAQELDLSEEPEFAKENGVRTAPVQEDAEVEQEVNEAPQQPKIKKTFVQNRELGSALRPRQPVKNGLSFSKPKPIEDPIFADEPVEQVEETQPPAYEAPVTERPSALARSNAVRPAASKPAVSEGVEVKGKLFGWMVSYKDPKGTATELREGKFFLSRSSLKNSDLIIDDSSISTPHALFGVSTADGVVLQDLMSDRGVFVREKGSETYQRILESIKLEHGDWVRFGDVEFQIAIL